jgi:translation initiation factor 2 subunit 2
MRPPQIGREGTKKTVFANFVEICRTMHRVPDHVFQFLLAELGTQGSIDSSDRLILKGRFQQKGIETVLRRYIIEYVTCHSCKSPDTKLDKENRLYFLRCRSCGASRTVAAIKSGFQAQVGKRSATKQA